MNKPFYFIILYTFLIKCVHLIPDGHFYMKNGNHVVNFSHPLGYHGIDCPPGIKKYYPYNKDCTKFIECDNGKSYLKHCPPVTGFNAVASECDHLYKVKCNSIHKDPVQMPSQIYCSIELFGIYPHPFSNEKYLKCVYGRLSIHSCRSGYVYHISNKFCHKDNYMSFDVLPPIQKQYFKESTIETQPDNGLTFLRCPPKLSGKFIYPFDCTKYVSCFKDKTRIMSCPHNTVYSIENSKCVVHIDENDHVECKRNNVNLYPEDVSSFGVFCPPEGSTKHPHPDDWHKYILCDNGSPFVEYCPRNQVFSIDTKYCIDEEVAIKADD